MTPFSCRGVHKRAAAAVPFVIAVNFLAHGKIVGVFGRKSGGESESDRRERVAAHSGRNIFQRELQGTRGRNQHNTAARPQPKLASVPHTIDAAARTHTKIAAILPCASPEAARPVGDEMGRSACGRITRNQHMRAASDSVRSVQHSDFVNARGERVCVSSTRRQRDAPPAAAEAERRSVAHPAACPSSRHLSC